MKTEISQIGSSIHLPQWLHLAHNQWLVNCAIWRPADDGGSRVALMHSTSDGQTANKNGIMH